MGYLISNNGDVYFYLKDRYINEINLSRIFFEKYISKKLSKYTKKEAAILNKKWAKYFGTKKYFRLIESSHYDIVEEFQRILFVEYRNISMQLINLINIWEQQCFDFLKANDTRELHNKLKEEYSFDRQNNEHFFEIIDVVNLLKHGEGGNSERNLRKINSSFILKSVKYGDIESTAVSTPILNIDISTINYFADKIIEFWNCIEASLINKYSNKIKNGENK